MSSETYQKEIAHLGESRGVEDHDHDMIHDLSRRLDALWRYDHILSMHKAITQCKLFGARLRNKRNRT